MEKTLNGLDDGFSPLVLFFLVKTLIDNEVDAQILRASQFNKIFTNSLKVDLCFFAID